VVGEVVLSVVVVVVVLVAEQDEVVQVGGAAVSPVPEVVGDRRRRTARLALTEGYGSMPLTCAC
jgi:hypothetical protein